MRTNRWWLSVGVSVIGLVGFSAEAMAATPECLLPSQCPNEKPICSFGTCKPCDNAIEGLSCLLSKNPGLTCAAAGDKKGQCVSVADAINNVTSTLDGGASLPGTSSSSSSSGSTPANPLPGTCFQDSDCGDGNSGLVCDVLQKACVAGCKINGNKCALGVSCSALSILDIGLCLIPKQDCTKDSDCGGGLSGTVCGDDNKCKPGCSGELLGNKCAVGLECKIDSVDAGPKKTGVCVLPTTPAPSSCKVDADCGEKYSGLICDSKTGSCINGCRADNGNECPLDMLCSATWDAFGLCIVGQPDGSAPVIPSSSSSSSGSSGTTFNPTNRKPIVSDNTSSSSSSGGAQVSASDDLSVEGGGCNVSSNDSNTTTGGAIFGLALGAIALVSRRNKNKKAA